VRRLAGILAASAIAFLVPLARETCAQAAEAQPAIEIPVAEAIDVDAGATCFDAERLAGEVRMWLGRERLASDVHVHVQGDGRDPRAVAFRIVRAGKSRDRRFAGLPAECEDATAVVGLAIALAIDAAAANDLVGAATSPERGKPRRAVTLQMGLGLEVIPGISLGGAIGMEYGLAEWLSARVDVLGQYSWGNSITGASGVFDVTLGAAAPQLCSGGSVDEHLRIELCSGIAGGIVHAQGRNYAVSRSSSGPWLVATGGLRLHFVAGIPWVLDVGGVFPLRVPSFRAEVSMPTGNMQSAVTPVYRDPSAAGALISVGPAFTF
jgi:hypothetical protein